MGVHRTPVKHIRKIIFTLFLTLALPPIFRPCPAKASTRYCRSAPHLRQTPLPTLICICAKNERPPSYDLSSTMPSGQTQNFRKFRAGSVGDSAADIAKTLSTRTWTTHPGTADRLIATWARYTRRDFHARPDCIRHLPASHPSTESWPLPLPAPTSPKGASRLESSVRSPYDSSCPSSLL